MTDRLEAWVSSFWTEPEKPGRIAPGQVYTLFDPGLAEPGRGTMVAAWSMRGDVFLAVPLHHEHLLRAPIEPLLESQDLDFPDALVAAVGLALPLAADAREDARFHGALTKAGMEKLGRAMDEHDRLQHALCRLRSREVGRGKDSRTYIPVCPPLTVRNAGPQVETGKNACPTEESAPSTPDAELIAAFEAGILKLVPPKASLAELAELRRRLDQNLAAPHCRALELIAAAKTNPPPLGISFEGVARIEPPEGLYLTLDDLLRASSSAEPRLPAASGRVFSQTLSREPNPPALEQVTYLRGLIHARLEDWNSSAVFFQSLLGGNRHHQALAGLIYVHRRQGDLGAAEKLLAELAPEPTPELAPQPLPETPIPNLLLLADLSQPDDLDREIASAWRELAPRPKK